MNLPDSFEPLKRPAVTEPETVWVVTGVFGISFSCAATVDVAPVFHFTVKVIFVGVVVGVAIVLQFEPVLAGARQ